MSNLAVQWDCDRTPEALGAEPLQPGADAALSDRDEIFAQKSAGATLAAAYRSQMFRAEAPARVSAPAPESAPVPPSAPVFTPTPFRPARGASADRDFSAFVGANEAKFAKAYAAQRAGERWRRAISWPAFFFPVVWLMYRKMYGLAAAVMVTPIVLNVLHTPPTLARGLMYWTVPLAGFGRHIYVWHARRTIAEIRASAADEATALDAIGRAGGVSRAGAALGVALSLTLVLALPLARHH